MAKTAQQAVAEFIATFTLIFIGAGSVIVAPQVAGTFGVAIAHGFVLVVMVSAIGHISGGHVNPAVTIAMWVTGKIESLRALVYILAQLAGAALGAYLITLVVPKEIWQEPNLGTPGLAEQIISPGKGVLLEAILTFFLVFTVFATAVDERGAYTKFAGLAIGFVLVFDIIFAGPFTGAAMNPARWFGPAVVSGTYTNWWVWLLGPISGGIVAGMLYWFVFLRSREGVMPPIEPAVESGAVPPAVEDVADLDEEDRIGGSDDRKDSDVKSGKDADEA